MISRGNRGMPPILDRWRDPVASTSTFRDVAEILREGGRAALPDLPGSLGPVLLSSLLAGGEIPGLLCIVPDAEDAEDLAQDFSALLGGTTVSLLRAWPFEAYEELSPSPTLVAERRAALLHLGRLDRGGVASVTSAPIWCRPRPSMRYEGASWMSFPLIWRLE